MVTPPPKTLPPVVLALGIVSSLILGNLCSCAIAVDEAERAVSSMNVPDDVEQVLLVTTPAWDVSVGTMKLFERKGESWKRHRVSFPVVVGRNGLGWGLGLAGYKSAGPEKGEGDGRAPAGAFTLGTAFGSAPKPPPETKFHYIHAGSNDFFVDDPRSADYNTWVRVEDGSDPKTRWRSFERMARTDSLYEYGIVVNHNTDPIVKGRGSAIFLHVWRSPSSPTAGCTAMQRENMIFLLQWLDPDRKPLLIQIPRELTGTFRIR